MMPLRIFQRLHDHFNGDSVKVREWLNTPNTRIRNMRPKDLLIREKGKRLDACIEEALLGKPKE